MKFITSLNPRARIERQRACLNSWKQYGLPILAVQSTEEYYIQTLFPEVDEVLPVAPSPNPFNSPWPSLASMCRFPGILINSDIDLSFSSDEFDKLIRAKDPVVGIRREGGVLNRFGIDLFISSTPYSPPKNGFVIGKPGWDYFLVLEWGDSIFHTLHHGLNHEQHFTNWNQAELRVAQSILVNRYGITQKQVTHRVQRITGRA